MKGVEWIWAKIGLIFFCILVVLGVNNYRYISHRAELIKEIKDYQEATLNRIKPAVVQAFEERGSDCGRGYSRLIGELYQGRYNAELLSRTLCVLIRNLDHDMPNQEYSIIVRRAVIECDSLNGLLDLLAGNKIDLAKAREMFDQTREYFESYAEKLKV